MNEPDSEIFHTEKVNPKLIRDIPRIEESDSILQRRSDIKVLVEEPLIPACEQLYDLNISTRRSSANVNDIAQGYGIISIDYPSLSDQNKELARTLCKEGKATLIAPENAPEDPFCVNLHLPLNTTTSAQEVSDAAIELASYFRKQKMTWALSYTLDQMRGWLNRPDKKPEEIAHETSLFFDPETQTFFVNEEQCLKTKEIVIEA